MKKFAILTSGGDAPGMNACIRAAVRYGIYCGYQVYGVERGYEGLINDDVFEMHSRSVSDTIQRGGTIIKTARSPEFKKPEVVERAVNNLRERDIDSLIVIGGDGSFRGLKDMVKLYGFSAVGIPGTIDNDLAYTDYTLGFDTAVNTVLDAINKVRDTMTSHDRVMIIEVMGRECGDIALHAAVAGGAEYAIIPELPVDIDGIAAGIAESSKRGKTSNMILLAEGCADMKDELIDKIQAKTQKTAHYTKLGYIQRGGTPTMFDRLLAAKMAVRAVDLIGKGKNGRLIGIRNNKIIDVDVAEALAMKSKPDDELSRIAQILSL
ncbi:MAG: 6-phosphofructokinase [Clostridiaceae bacterium]|jgi:6-phosphofructokinase 1|nr:6-phosphofructokinase [Clostridiaceae bacterium]